MRIAKQAGREPAGVDLAEAHEEPEDAREGIKQAEGAIERSKRARP